MSSIRSSFEPENFYTLPVGIALMFVVGFVFSMLTATHAWGILIPVILVAYAFALVPVVIYFARFAKVRTVRGGLVVGCVLFPGYVIGEIVGSSLVEGDPAISWFAHRWGEGVELFGGGSYTIRSWMWAVAYVIKLLGLFVLIPVPIMLEGERQFCELCRTHTTRKVWKNHFGKFDKADLLSRKSLRDMLTLQSGHGGTHSIRVRVRACKCKSLCEMQTQSVSAENEHVGDNIIDAQILTPLGLNRLMEWIITIDPQVIDERVMAKLSEIGAQRKPFDRPIRPDGEEWRSVMRWGSMTAMEWYADTEYTHELRQRLMQGDYRAVNDALRKSANINDTACIYEASADWSNAPDWIDLWCDEEPESSAAHCVRGIQYVKQAWIKRGSGWEPKNFAVFQALLSEAMGSLMRATELDPGNRVAHAWKIYAGKGMQQGDDVLRAYFDAACTLAPGDTPGTERDLLAAHWMYFDAITPKWGGSSEQLQRFAQECLAKCPNGSPGLATIPFIHHELASVAREQSQAEMDSYLADTRVRSQIVEAYKKAFTTHRESMVTPRVRAIFAGMLWLTGELDLARVQLEHMGKSTPWGPFVSSVFVFSKFRLSAARKACGL